MKSKSGKKSGKKGLPKSLKRGAGRAGQFSGEKGLDAAEAGKSAAAPSGAAKRKKGK